MNKIILILLTFITLGFSLDQKSMNHTKYVLRNPSDSIVTISLTTNWRSHFDFKTYKCERFQDPSELVLILNMTRGIGCLLDETPSITSYYEINEFSYNTVTDKYGIDNILINFLIKSDVGNSYSVILNDAQRQLLFTGPNAPFAIIREFEATGMYSAKAIEIYNKLFGTKI